MDSIIAWNRFRINTKNGYKSAKTLALSVPCINNAYLL